MSTAVIRAFDGDHELKAVVQTIAVESVLRPDLQHHPQQPAYMKSVLGPDLHSIQMSGMRKQAVLHQWSIYIIHSSHHTFNLTKKFHLS